MATEKRLIDAHDLWSDIMMLPHNGDIISSEEVEQAIKDAPTVDAVEVVHGKWVSEYEYDFMSCEVVRTGFSCNRCGCYYKKRSNYCPNCGAKMDGERKENNNAEN